MVVMHILRSELLFGDGLPLGIIVSPWSFTSLRYISPKSSGLLALESGKNDG
jgi:hypothetical protein